MKVHQQTNGVAAGGAGHGTRRSGFRAFGRLAVVWACALVAACAGQSGGSPAPDVKPPVSEQSRGGSDGSDSQRGITIASPQETIDIEHGDRVERLTRLARQESLPDPEISSDLTMPKEALPGIDYEVPVMRLRFPMRAFFETDESELRPASLRAVDVVARTLMQGVPDAHVMVVGHTDARASVQYNQRLSERRARSAIEHMERLGVASRRIDFVGMSERQPIARNDTAEGRALNRRVEFVISSFREANIHFVRTRNIVCDYLDQSEFNRESCLRLAQPRPVPVDRGDPTGEVDIDPGMREIRDAATLEQKMDSSTTQERDVDGQDPLQQSIRISPEPDEREIRLPEPKQREINVKPESSDERAGGAGDDGVPEDGPAQSDDTTADAPGRDQSLATEDGDAEGLNEQRASEASGEREVKVAEKEVRRIVLNPPETHSIIIKDK